MPTKTIDVHYWEFMDSFRSLVEIDSILFINIKRQNKSQYIIKSIERYNNLDINLLLQLYKHLNVIFSQGHCLLFLRMH